MQLFAVDRLPHLRDRLLSCLAIAEHANLFTRLDHLRPIRLPFEHRGLNSPDGVAKGQVSYPLRSSRSPHNITSICAGATLDNRRALGSRAYSHARAEK